MAISKKPTLNKTSVPHDSAFAAAVAQLAAAAMVNNPQLSIGDAVRSASEHLRSAAAPGLTARQISDSVRPDKIICLEDGTWHVMLRRYIKRKFNLTPRQYLEKWGLPEDYPFVAPNYSGKRSRIAKKTGLGRK
ncbi:hypothetical protein FACS189421_09310 [Bacteroidia bacterium]|nr:hypothetical protein FACS189421_09310 [Bacteroidia bacterium]